MPPPVIGGGIKRCFCLTSVCLSVAYIGPKSRTERPRKTNIGTEIAHVTRDSDTAFKVKGQGHEAALLSVALTRKAAAAVRVGTYSAWESTATLRLLGGARGARAPTGELIGRGILCRHAHSLLKLACFLLSNRNFTLKRMPVPFNDVTAAMKINADRTESALQKVSDTASPLSLLTPY